MNDRDFINNLIKVYFSNAQTSHQATLDNAITNRLNDIADKLENQEKFIDIVKRKGLFISAKELNTIENSEDYKGVISERKLQQELMLHIIPTLIDLNNLDNTMYYNEEEFNVVKEILNDE